MISAYRTCTQNYMAPEFVRRRPTDHRLDFFFFNDTTTTEIYTLSLHDALPICCLFSRTPLSLVREILRARRRGGSRSEEHTSELQSRRDVVCRLVLEKKYQFPHLALSGSMRHFHIVRICETEHIHDTDLLDKDT